MPPSLADLVFAFRQAKNAIAAEKGVVGLFDLARFEMELATRLKRLRGFLDNDRWFDRLSIGRLVVTPKSTEVLGEDRVDVVRVGDDRPRKLNLTVTLRLEPTPEFAITEVLYLWEFGGALEALLGGGCFGYRLKRVREDGQMDRRGRDVYEYWPPAYARYRDDPIRTAKKILLQKKSVTITSTDVASFFDSIDPAFLVTPPFIEKLKSAASKLGREFDAARYTVATRSLLARFSEFRGLRTSLSASLADSTGVPIGAFTSRVFANIALASVDAHIESVPGVVLYRRYVDDIVVVSERQPGSPSPTSKKEALQNLFPGYTPDDKAGRFVVPDTGASFVVKDSKTRVHDLTGPSAVDFLDSVRERFSAVSSERRAFLSDIEVLTRDIENVALSEEDEEQIGRLPRLRDADRFTLRRFMASTYVFSLDRCAQLLAPKETARFLEGKTKRLLSVIDGIADYEDFEFVISVLKIALRCRADAVVKRLMKWLDRCRSVAGIESVQWRGSPVPRGRALKLLAAYLDHRIKESIASAYPLMPAESRVPKGLPWGVRSKAILLRAADLRHSDREDEITESGKIAGEFTPKAVKEYALVRSALRSDEEAEKRIGLISRFMGRSVRLGEKIWADMPNVALLLSRQPPKYIDVSRRYLARLEQPGDFSGELGREIDECVDALRGTRHRFSRTTRFSVSTNGNRVLRLEEPLKSQSVRVVLGNLPIPVSAFEAAARGRPELTFDRLKNLSQSLRYTRDAMRRPRLPSILVLPELSIPQRWARALAAHAVREGLSLVAGVEYEATKEGLINQAMGVFPTGMSTGALVRWTKRNPASGESVQLKELRKRFRSGGKDWQRLVVETPTMRLGVLICSELLESSALTTLAGRVELVLVPAWNDDANSFDHAVNSAASLHIHAFVAVANNAAAGSDSRIVAPIKEPRWEREWCRLIQREENQIIWAILPAGELRAFHERARGISRGAGKRRSRRREYRPMPPDTSGK